jgi:hypothetical protein
VHVECVRGRHITHAAVPGTRAWVRIQHSASENNNIFTSNAQEKALSDSRWSSKSGAPAVLSEFSLLPTNPTHPLIYKVLVLLDLVLL